MARYVHNVDAKGRVIVPARVRNTLGSKLFVTLSLDKGYLSAYNETQFRDILSQLSEQSGTDPDFRRFRRQFLGSAVECDLDAQGRISLNDELWSSIGIKAGEEVCFIDMFDKVEICAKHFDEERREQELQLSEMDLSRYNVKGL